MILDPNTDMAANFFIPREHRDEPRVAATPETVKRLIREGFHVTVESGAGQRAHYEDDAYRSEGAEVVTDADSGWRAADVVLAVNTGTVGIGDTPTGGVGALKAGAVIVGFLATAEHRDVVRRLRDSRVSALAMELIPRISRAQAMDALSSQASIAGYKAVLLAASQLDKYFPLMMTAAGTIKPARVVVMGAGVAGLQAVATARRLGAVVEVSDIRPAVKEQVESLGGKFIDVPMEESGEGEGGYAKEVSPEFLEKQQAIVKERVVAADAVITTAQVPGKKAPRLITAEMVRQMRNGAVIVDLAVAQGGNCELSELDKTVEKEGVTIVGEANLAASVPADASRLYARNVLELILHVSNDGEVSLDLEDEITRSALLTHAGEVMHAASAELLEGEGA